MAKAGVPVPWLPRLGVLKIAAAVGLVVGFSVPLIGTAAAVGVILYFVGAVVTHLRAHDYTLGPAISSLVLAGGALALRLAASRAFGLGVLSR